MIKGIKGGLSHARKDKVKIQFEIEFKKLNNISNDLIDQFVTIKWERGKFKGESSSFRIQKHIISPEVNNSLISSTPLIEVNGIPSKFSNNNSSKRNSISSTSQNQTQTQFLENLNKVTGITPTGSLTKKQSKMLLGSKIDGTNNMIGGDGYAMITNEKIQLKMTFFSDSVHSKIDNSVQTNFEQKLLTVSLHGKHSLLVSVNIDLSMHMDDNRNTLIVPFPSSTPLHPSLDLTIKSKYLKYNDKKVTTITRDGLAKKYSLSPLESHASNTNRLMEIQGNIYYVIASDETTHQGNGSQKSTEQDLSHQDVTENTYSIMTDDDDDDEYHNADDDPFQVVNANGNPVYSHKEKDREILLNQINDLNSKLHTKEAECNDLRRLNDFEQSEKKRYQSIIDDCRAKVLEYEENAHRAQSIESFTRNQLRLERFEFQRQMAKKEEACGDNDKHKNSELTNKNLQLTKSNKNLLESIDEMNKEILQYREKMEQSQLEINQLKTENTEHTVALENQKDLYNKVVSDLTELEFKCERERRSAPNSPVQSNTKSTLFHRINNNNSADNGDSSPPLLPSIEKPIQSGDPDISFFDLIKKMASKNYPSILQNPFIAWSFALFCFIMFLTKALE
ncbi:hypothetical protein DLAC_01844 [Tieghemostelium lacteum]|uniref:Uncharacterized protein n=1 Tax=Tieghemostelium lacteum TaxID=361077 RepID=A0A152A705_TIELA|nr:hypothetical protein DLAC_01844 [Tieghemostelium lacteum]|eukprot:KYR01827.1 hypothetical protein DLAC_01844 [Tieghemostelium lacteum]